MKVYNLCHEDEPSEYCCYDDPQALLKDLDEWAAEEARFFDDEEKEELAKEVACIKEVIAKGKGGFTGEVFSVWTETRSKKWFDTLPRDSDEEVPHV